MQPSSPEPAAWAWLGILLILIGFESWALLSNNLTMSEWFRGWVKSPGLWWLSFVGFTYLGYHLFFVPR